MGDGQYIDVALATGSDSLGDTRGAAPADFNGDGRLDIAMSNNNGQPTILLNQLEDAGHWLAFSLEGRQSNRSAVGARVTLGASGKTITRWVEAGSGFSSQAPLNAHMGLGPNPVLESLEILWPSGLLEQWNAGDLEGVALDQTLHIVEGEKQLQMTRLER